MKRCFKCGESKDFEFFHKKGKSKSGNTLYVSWCKICSKNKPKRKETYWSKLKQNPILLEKHREKRRKNKEKVYVSNKILATHCKKYKNKYPEKILCHEKIRYSPLKERGYNLHHWNYNLEYATDIIKLSLKEHGKAHRFIIYDQGRFMYRRYDNNELLDTKEKHLEFITKMINIKPD